MVKTVTLREAWSGEADCRNCALRTTALFGGLEESDFDRIHDPIDQFDLTPGTSLYQTGDHGDYMYTVSSALPAALTCWAWKPSSATPIGTTQSHSNAPRYAASRCASSRR